MEKSEEPIKAKARAFMTDTMSDTRFTGPFSLSRPPRISKSINYDWKFKNMKKPDQKRFVNEVNPKISHRKNLNWETRDSFSFHSIVHMNKSKQIYDKLQS